jgi:hypothetical protein
MAKARSRLALRRAEKPATKAAQIRALWPDIEAAISAGQTMKTICTWLAEDAGITVAVTSLTSYVSRIRRREEASRCAAVRPLSASRSTPPDARLEYFPTRTEIVQSSEPAPSSEAKAVPEFDPLANYHRSEAKRPGFHYRPATPDDAKDLI